MTVATALRTAAEALASHSDTPRLDAELLMAHALGASRSDLLLRHMRDPVPPAFARLVERRVADEPVAYILGRQEFFGLEFMVSPDVLIPRADSETLVEQAIAGRPDAGRVLDCGTGSGALLLAVLAHLPGARGTGIDRSAGAIAVAGENAARLGLAGRARFLLADWSVPGWKETLDAPFDLILANPPYVESEAELAPSVRRFEPAGALFAGVEGLDAYRTLIPQIGPLLAPEGLALFEIGAGQTDPVAGLAGECGYRAELFRDLAQRPRLLALSRLW